MRAQEGKRVAWDSLQAELDEPQPRTEASR